MFLFVLAAYLLLYLSLHPVDIPSLSLRFYETRV